MTTYRIISKDSVLHHVKAAKLEARGRHILFFNGYGDVVATFYAPISVVAI